MISLLIIKIKNVLRHITYLEYTKNHQVRAHFDLNKQTNKSILKNKIKTILKDPQGTSSSTRTPVCVKKQHKSFQNQPPSTKNIKEKPHFKFSDEMLGIKQIYKGNPNHGFASPISKTQTSPLNK